jgi:PAS domain S-box-containing protein
MARASAHAPPAPAAAERRPRCESLSSVRGTLVGLVAIAALTALKLVLADSLGFPTPYLLYFGAALTAAWFGGLTAGLATTVAAVLTGYLVFARPVGGSEASGLVGAAAAILECSTIAAITSGLRRATLGGQTARSELEAALAQLRAVVDGAGDGVTMQDASGALLFANDRAARLIGFASAAELLKTPLAEVRAQFDLRNEDGEPLSYEDLPGRVLLRGGEPHELLVRFTLRPGGDERWSRVRANAVRDERGAIRYVVNTFRDATLERHAEHELQLSREWLATALRSIGDAVVTTDARGKITFLNPIAEKLTGWTAREAVDRSLDEIFCIFHESTRDRAESPVAHVIRDGVIVGLANHTVLVRRDGTEVAIDDSAAPIHDESGALVGVVLVFRDVSQQRRKELRKAFLMRATAEVNSSLDYESTLATVARLAVPTIADWCAVDMVDAADARPRRLAVAHVDPAKIQTVREIEARYPPDLGAPAGVPNVLRTGKPEMMQHIPPELIDAAAIDDEHRALLRALSLRSYVAVPIRHGERTLGVISLVMAESNRSYDEEDLVFATALGERVAVAIENAALYREAERLRAEAESANRSKDEFLAMLGHELRNPLAPIVTALHLMEKRSGGENERERTVIKRQLDHVVRLVDDLLDVSRITQGKVDLVREPVDLALVVERALEMSSPLLEARAHEVVVDVPFGISVNGDRTRLGQVVANLVQNAAKYTAPGGHITIRGTREGGDAVLSVQDDGMGIAPELLGRVFDVFTQGRQDTARASGGLGLGLAIVKSLVSLHGGTVEAKSDGSGRGTEMVVRLPATDSVARAEAPLEKAPPAVPRGHASETILLVDDHDDGREMMAIALESNGYRVVSAPDGPSAIELAKQERPSIALLDVGLPGMDGYELAGRLRGLSELAGLRLVAVTGYGQASDRARSKEAGFDEHLTKPVSLDAIQKTVSRLLDRRAA